jgi:predicted RNA polymerase sigma factor
LEDVEDTRLKQAAGLEAVYRTDGPAIWRALLAYTGDSAVAEDALSEAFAQALGRGDALRDPARWIWRVAFRICRR